MKQPRRHITRCCSSSRDQNGLTPSAAAKDFGNWTRFVNHNCNPNVSVIIGMYGRRRSVVFRANRDIPAGEQLGIHYGENYFNQLQISCNCGVHAGPHMPVGSGPGFPWPPEEDSEGSEYLP